MNTGRSAECWHCPECAAQLWLQLPSSITPTCRLGHPEQAMERRTVEQHPALDSNGHSEVNGEDRVEDGW